ncbi:MAG TPA: hypothetical protein ENL20_11120, partial [Candidatus Cloacimonetes bacterium]|nr:hypothetical protein [Candidatus Cloacimonadota bacterium]
MKKVFCFFMLVVSAVLLNAEKPQYLTTPETDLTTETRHLTASELAALSSRDDLRHPGIIEWNDDYEFYQNGMMQKTIALDETTLISIFIDEDTNYTMLRGATIDGSEI